MSEYSYIQMSEKERETLERAKVQEFGEGQRISVGAYVRLLAEQVLEEGEADSSEETA